MSHEENADFVHDHAVRVDADHHRDASFKQDLTNLLGVTRRDEGHLNVLTIASDQVFDPRLMHLVHGAVTSRLKLKVELFELGVVVSVA